MTSPLRARHRRAGVQAPLGFWDPAGLSADGDAREPWPVFVVDLAHKQFLKEVLKEVLTQAPNQSKPFKSNGLLAYLVSQHLHRTMMDRPSKVHWFGHPNLHVTCWLLDANFPAAVELPSS